MTSPEPNPLIMQIKELQLLALDILKEQNPVAYREFLREEERDNNGIE